METTVGHPKIWDLKMLPYLKEKTEQPTVRNLERERERETEKIERWKKEEPCSLGLHEVGALFKKLSGFSKNRPAHCTRGEPFFAESNFIPSQQSRAETEEQDQCQNRHGHRH